MTHNTPDSLQVVSVELLQSLAAEIATATPTAAVPRQDHGDGERFDIDAFIQRHGLEVDGPEPWNGQQGPGRRWTFRRSPMCEHHDDGPFILQHASTTTSATRPANNCSPWLIQSTRGQPLAGLC